MSVIDNEIIESIKLVASLQKMGENESAKILGRKILDNLSNGKDGLLFSLAYDVKNLNEGDVATLLDAAFIEKCCEEVYRSFKALSAGSKAEYWFSSGQNNPDLHRFFMFMSRSNRQLNLDSDISILHEVLRALSKNPSYTIPTGLGKYTLDNFLRGLATGEIRVDREGIR